MSRKLTDLPAATALESADLALLTQDVATTPISRSIQGSLLGGQGLQFELDTTSLSQFVDGADPSLKDGGGGTNARLSTVSVAGRGDAIRYTPNGGTNVVEIFMFSQVLTFNGTARNMVVEAEFTGTPAANNQYWGVFFMGDADAPVHGFGHLVGLQNDWGFLLNNGTLSKATTTGNGGSKYARWNVVAKKPASDEPVVSSYVQAWGNSTMVGGVRRSDVAPSSANTFGNGATFGATWDSLSLDRIGFCIGSVNGAGPPSTVDILSFKVFVR